MPRRFENISSLHLSVDGDELGLIMGIPDEFMEHIRDLALTDRSLGLDPTGFMSTASAMIKKTHRLVNLQLIP